MAPHSITGAIDIIDIIVIITTIIGKSYLTEIEFIKKPVAPQA
jgi:hypothetical protein